MEYVVLFVQIAVAIFGIIKSRSVVIFLLRNKPKSIKRKFDSKGNLIEYEVTYRDYPQ